MVGIYTADWVFYGKDGREVISKDVITKKIPIEFVIADEMTVRRALRPFSETQIKTFATNKKTGNYKIKINYIKKLGEVMNDEQRLEELH